jgi:hypothetical protein
VAVQISAMAGQLAVRNLKCAAAGRSSKTVAGGSSSISSSRMETVVLTK